MMAWQDVVIGVGLGVVTIDVLVSLRRIARSLSEIRDVFRDAGRRGR